MAKPSIKIWKASIYDGRGSTAASLLKEDKITKMLPGEPGSMKARGSVRGELDEARELQRALGDFRRPDRDLLAILPLQHQAGDQALAVLDRMGELVVLAVELDAADGADPVGLLQRRHQLVRIGRSGALDGVGDVVDFVIRGVAGIGRKVAELRLEPLRERQALFGDRDVRARHALIEHAFRGAVGVSAEGRVGSLRGDPEH